MPSPSVPETGARAILLNRVLIALGFVGLFVSGYLSYVKVAKILPLCGVEGGCLAVTEHPSAYWFSIPVAFFGLAGYLAITGLAILREITGRELSKPLVGIGLLLSTFGFFASGYLQYTAIMVIHELCKWCLGSAITMLLTFVGHVLLFGQASDAVNPVYRPRLKAIPFVVAGLFITAVSIGLVPNAGGATVKDAHLAAGTELVPPSANSLGDANAPLTIVEFADFCCPACRKTAMSSRDLVKKYPGKVRLVFRHFPLLGLEGHEMAGQLAITSEYAAKHGKFWAFHEAVMTSPEAPKTTDEVLTLAKNVGLDPEEVGKIVDASPSDSYDRVYRDISEAMKLKVGGTPTFFVQVKNGPTKIVKFDALDKELESGEFAGFVH